MPEIKSMNLDEVEARKAELGEELAEASNERLAEISAELDELEARKAELADMAEKRAALEARVMTEGTKVETFEELETIEERKEDKPMIEVRNTPEYIEAFARYIKNEDPTECRALLSDNVNGGVVPVPSVVEDRVRTAWEKDGIMSRVRKTYIRGNLKVGFELSATGAVVHTEGAAAPTEETLVIGVVSLVPASIKKWITISDEVMDLTGEAFLDYIYDEVTYQIAHKAAADLVTAIATAGTASTATAVGVPAIKATTITQPLIAQAMGKLSEEAADPVIIMNRETEAAFKGVQYSGSFATDIFEGLPRVYSSALKAFSAATSGDTYAIVGDLGRGAQANFPNGNEITIKFDDLSLAEKDLVKIVGREFVALGVVGPGCFVNITK